MGGPTLLEDSFIFLIFFWISCCPVQVSMTLALAYHIGSLACTCTIAVKFRQIQQLIPDPASYGKRSSPAGSANAISNILDLGSDPIRELQCSFSFDNTFDTPIGSRISNQWKRLRAYFLRLVLTSWLLIPDPTLPAGILDWLLTNPYIYYTHSLSNWIRDQ